MSGITPPEKYRAVIIAIAMFVLLDAVALATNFYLANQISANAVNVNMAGRQRMLSQKAIRALIETRHLDSENRYEEPVYKEFIQTVALFDNTLTAFQQGGETQGPRGESVFLEALLSEGSDSILKESLKLWQPFKKMVEELDAQTSEDKKEADQQLDKLVGIAKNINQPLLKLANDLTNNLEQTARKQSEAIRQVQVVVICLAIVNFIWILYFFIARLHRHDERVKEVQEQSSALLANLREGALLLDDKLMITHQHSASIHTIFGQKEYTKLSFRDLLADIVTVKELDTAEEYIKLLLNIDVKEKLIETLNPLLEIEVNFEQENGAYLTKHLSIRFNRFIKHQSISYILVTVLDITEAVELRRQLAVAHDNHGLQLNVIKQISHLNYESVSQYLRECESALLAVNDVLKEKAKSEGDYKSKIASIFRIVHKVKGNARAIEISPIVDAAHELEDKLTPLQDKELLQGGDFLPVTLSLKQFLALVVDLQEMVEVFYRSRQANGSQESIVSVSELQTESRVSEPVAGDTGVFANTDLLDAKADKERLEHLAQSIAASENKLIVLSFIDYQIQTLSIEYQKGVEDAIIQLVRNAVVHGIEPVGERRKFGKPEHGHIAVSMMKEKQGLRVKVRDDGQGVNQEELRRMAVDRGLYTEEEVLTLSSTKLTSLIFEPGFSTQSQTSTDAGRGVGMDLVRANVNKMHGKIRIGSRQHRYCEISFWLPEAALEGGAFFSQKMLGPGPASSQTSEDYLETV